MFDREGFLALYDALDRTDQTVDEAGRPVDCGIRCGKFCCSGQNASKYLLPGEAAFLSAELERQGQRPHHFTSLLWFDTFTAADPASACACDPLRALRPFNCRIFPYGPVIAERRVVAVQKSKRAHLEPCWIETPAPAWEAAAIEAWQTVLDDPDNRLLFAKMQVLWELSQAAPAEASLVVLAGLDRSDEGLWARCARFFVASQTGA